MSVGGVWEVPGYAADELLGVVATGEAWRGRSTVGGDVVRLERWRGGAPAWGSASAAVEHPHLLRLREVVPAGADVVLVFDPAPGGSLAALLRRRGRLRPGEVVALLAPLADALALVHQERAAHLQLSTTSVVFAADGTPLLAGPALPSARPGPDGPGLVTADPADDVFTLGSIGGLALTGAPAPRLVADAGSGRSPGLPDRAPEAPPELIRVLQWALAAKRESRPDAPTFAAALRQTVPAEPIRLGAPPPAASFAPPDPASAPAASTGGGRHRSPPEQRRVRAREGAAGLSTPPERRRRRRLWRAGILAAALLTVLLAAVLAGSRGTGSAARGADEVQASGSGPAAPADDRRRWTTVLDALDVLRAAAYERGDVALLAQVYAGGPHLTADARQLRTLTGAGVTVRGVRHRLAVLEVLGGAAHSVRLRVSQALPPSTRFRSGRPVGTEAGSPPREVVLGLVLTEYGWRLA